MQAGCGSFGLDPIAWSCQKNLLAMQKWWVCCRGGRRGWWRTRSCDALKDERDYLAAALAAGRPAVDATAVVPAIDFRDDASLEALGLPRDAPHDHLVVQWTGIVRVAAAGEYAFSTASDDGSYLWVDSALVVSNGGLHGVETARGRVHLDAGNHEVKVDLFECEGGAAITARYAGPDTRGEEVLLRGVHWPSLAADAASSGGGGNPGAAGPEISPPSPPPSPPPKP
jgi:hypothetical protein